MSSRNLPEQLCKYQKEVANNHFSYIAYNQNKLGVILYITIANKTILTKTSFLAIVAVGTLCYLSNLSTYCMVTSADTSDYENEEIKFCQEIRYHIH